MGGSRELGMGWGGIEDGMGREGKGREGEGMMSWIGGVRVTDWDVEKGRRKGKSRRLEMERFTEK